MDAKIYINRDYGTVVSAVLAPADAGFGFCEAAIASLDTRGVARVYERDGQKAIHAAQEKEWGREMAPELRAALQAAIDEEIAEDIRIRAAKDYRNGE